MENLTFALGQLGWNPAALQLVSGCRRSSHERMSSATKYYIVVEVVHMILRTEDVYHTCIFTTRKQYFSVAKDIKCRIYYRGLLFFFFKQNHQKACALKLHYEASWAGIRSNRSQRCPTVHLPAIVPASCHRYYRKWSGEVHVAQRQLEPNNDSSDGIHCLVFQQTQWPRPSCPLRCLWCI